MIILKKIKVMYILWAVMVVVIIGLLTWLGFVYQKKLEPYKNLEFNLTETAEKYVELNFIYPEAGDTLIIKAEDLRKNNLIDELIVNKDKCDGYVKLTFNGVYNYKSFIKCDNYTTKGY